MKLQTIFRLSDLEAAGWQLDGELVSHPQFGSHTVEKAHMLQRKHDIKRCHRVLVCMMFIGILLLNLL